MKKLFDTYFFIDEEQYNEGIRPALSDYLFFSIPFVASILAVLIVVGWA